MIIEKQDLDKYPPIPIGNARDLTNQKKNRLTPLYRVKHPKHNKGVFWLFKCDCGNYTITDASSFMKERTKSCGCYNKEVSRQSMRKMLESYPEPWNKKDLTGQQFGEWTVLQLDENGGDKHHRKWICQCSCGKIQSVFGCNLGRISFSCGHTRTKSLGEEKIKQLLTENNINFETEKLMFQYGPRANAKFDFFVENKYLIEYDGTTHYIPVGGWNTQEAIDKQQERDAIKNQWCIDNNMPLIRIPYTHLKELTIDDLKLETTTFLINMNFEN